MSVNRVKDRMTEHLKSIIRMKNNLDTSLSRSDDLTEVAVHFNTKNHIVSKHFRFDIFENNVNAFG